MQVQQGPRLCFHPVDFLLGKKFAEEANQLLASDFGPTVSLRVIGLLKCPSNAESPIQSLKPLSHKLWSLVGGDCGWNSNLGPSPIQQ